MGYEEHIDSKIELFLNNTLIASGTVKKMEDYVASPAGDASIFVKSRRDPTACRGFNIHFVVDYCLDSSSDFDFVTIGNNLQTKAKDRLTNAKVGYESNIVFFKVI